MVIQNSLEQIRKQVHTFITNKPHLLILGIGENRMGDDGLGQYISFNLDEKIHHPSIKIINGGIVPEERFTEIVKFNPELMILIDSVDSGKQPGSIAFYEDVQMMNYLPISSHSLPLPILVDRVKHALPQLSVKLLGIQPFSLDFLDNYTLFKEDVYSLDDKEKNPNIPFYAFNLSSQMEVICNELIEIFLEVLSARYEI